MKSVIAQRDQARSKIKNSEAEVDQIQSIISELTLVSPRLGRVQYQLARAGEVVAAGSPIVTILDLTDVYMTLFLPAGDAGRLNVSGIEAGSSLIRSPTTSFRRRSAPSPPTHSSSPRPSRPRTSAPS